MVIVAAAPIANAILLVVRTSVTSASSTIHPYHTDVIVDQCKPGLMGDH